MDNILQSNNTEKVRAALASWLMTMFNAENVVDLDKLYRIKLIHEDSEIGYSDVSLGKKMTLEQSTRILSHLSDDAKAIIVSILDGLASIDKYCAPSEAILLSALEYDLVEKAGMIFSIKANGLRLDGKTAYFVLPSAKSDNGIPDPEGISGHVQKHLQELVMLFYCFGYDFAYIPKIVEDYSKDEETIEALKNFACNFSDYPAEDVIMAIEGFSSFGTAEFTRMLFANRKNDNIEDHKDPGIIIKINDSMVSGEKYFNFIYLPIHGNGISAIIDTTKRFFDKYQSKVSYTSYLVTPELPNRLRHFDLYSTLLRYRIKNGKKIPSKLTIDFFREQIIFDDLGYKLHLGVDIVDYLFIAWQSYNLDKLKSELNKRRLNQLAPLKEARRILRDDDYPHNTMENCRKKSSKIAGLIRKNVPGLANPTYYCPVKYADSDNPMVINYELKVKDIHIIDSDKRSYHISEAPICKILEKVLYKF